MSDAVDSIYSIKYYCKEMNETRENYHQLISHMKELRMFFHKKYNAHFKLGNVYQGNPDFCYFSLQLSI